MNLKQQYQNLLKNFRKEMLKNATLEKMYNDKCVESSIEIQDLNHRFALLYQGKCDFSTGEDFMKT